MGRLSARVASIQDLSQEVVTVPEWGDLKVLVKGLTLGERNRLTLATRDKNGDSDVEKFYPALIIATCYDPDEPDAKAFDSTDMAMLNRKNGGATDRIARVALRLSGLVAADDEPTGNDGEEAPSPIDEAGKESSSAVS